MSTKTDPTTGLVYRQIGETRFINLTPGTIQARCIDGNVEEFPPSGQVAAVEVKSGGNWTRDTGTVSVKHAPKLGNITGLPPASSDPETMLYLVTPDVFAALRDVNEDMRADVASGSKDGIYAAWADGEPLDCFITGFAEVMG